MSDAIFAFEKSNAALPIAFIASGLPNWAW
jgi:hypothetical protein